ncbi:hypothetical protein ACMFMG_011551 [Clarireedia jacksonii]
MEANAESQVHIAQRSNTLLEENRELHNQVLALREASAQNQARNEDIDRLASKFTTTLAAKEREKLALEEEVVRLKNMYQVGEVEHTGFSSDKESLPSIKSTNELIHVQYQDQKLLAMVLTPVMIDQWNKLINLWEKIQEYNRKWQEVSYEMEIMEQPDASEQYDEETLRSRYDLDNEQLQTITGELSKLYEEMVEPTEVLFPKVESILVHNNLFSRDPPGWRRKMGVLGREDSFLPPPSPVPDAKENVDAGSIPDHQGEPPPKSNRTSPRQENVPGFLGADHDSDSDYYKDEIV